MTATLATEPSCRVLSRLYARSWSAWMEHHAAADVPLDAKLRLFDALCASGDDDRRTALLVSDIERERE